MHSNTAFALALLVEAFEALGRGDVVDAIRVRASTWFGSDRDIQTTFEPSGSDFLSPTLSEVELMRRRIPPHKPRDCVVTQRIGNVAVLYRPRPELARIVIPD